jgi:hypothetical protein
MVEAFPWSVVRGFIENVGEVEALELTDDVSLAQIRRSRVVGKIVHSD